MLWYAAIGVRQKIHPNGVRMRRAAAGSLRVPD
jgi:hypothetical protein